MSAGENYWREKCYIHQWSRDLARALLAQIHSAVVCIESEDSPHMNTCVH